MLRFFIYSVKYRYEVAQQFVPLELFFPVKLKKQSKNKMYYFVYFNQLLVFSFLPVFTREYTKHTKALC